MSETWEIPRGSGAMQKRTGLWGQLFATPVWAPCRERTRPKGILPGPVPELIVLSHLLLPLLSFCYFHLELSQLSGQFLLVLSIEVLQLLPKRTGGTRKLNRRQSKLACVPVREPASPAQWAQERDKDKAGVLGYVLQK